MASTKNVVVFRKRAGTDGMIEIIKKVSQYKMPIRLKTRRGDCILETNLSQTTILNLFKGWSVKHQTPKRIVLAKE